MDVHEAEPAIFVLQYCTSLIALQPQLNPSGTLGLLSLPPVVLPAMRSLVTAAKAILPFIITTHLEDLTIGALHLPLIWTQSLGPCALVAAGASVVELELTFRLRSRINTLVGVLQGSDQPPTLTTLRIVEESRRVRDDMSFDPRLGARRARQNVATERATLESFGLSLYTLAQDDSQSVRTLSFDLLEQFRALAAGGFDVYIANEATVLIDL
ncbi:hypothetical protein B0H16DRAFT_1462877 [Mycena metata]|uniref:Uncharacterized protein n=1 Tax=Mycena metata TaxID=1033252 RepID=A0AAD7IKV3_9AGAR|nr:hypothetical protein B0H16DRAFT_1462877 [Mycena metata]